MKKFLKNLKGLLSLTSVVLSYHLLILSSVLAQENPNSNSSLSQADERSLIPDNQELEGEETPIQQIQQLARNAPPELDEEILTNVNQLSDVNPNDWAYEALKTLVEKYRCISGFPDGNFRGNQKMTRYEFAAAFNSCLLTIRRSIEGLNQRFLQKEDLRLIERLEAEFATDFINLTDDLDTLEEQITFLEEHQFSPTTLLQGRVDFYSISAFGDQKAVSPGNESQEELEENPTFAGRTILRFDTSFTGKDKLRTQLIAGNINSFGTDITGTEMTLLTGTTNTNNNLRLGTLFYQFPLGKRGVAAFAPVADFPTRIFPAFNPVNSISNFGAESPIYSFAFGSGAVIYYNFTDKLAGGISYLTTSAFAAKEGLFNGQYTILSQVSYTPSEQFGIAFTYGHYYAPEPGSTVNVTGSKGSLYAQLPFGEKTPTSSHAFGLQFTYKPIDDLILGGWISYFNPKAAGSPSASGLNGSEGSQADIWSWAVTAFLADLGKSGSQLSFVFGMPPKVINNDISGREDPDTSLHFELSYRYPITERISLTPGFLVVTSPEHNAENPPIWIGLIQTSFTF